MKREDAKTRKEVRYRRMKIEMKRGYEIQNEKKGGGMEQCKQRRELVKKKLKIRNE